MKRPRYLICTRGIEFKPKKYGAKNYGDLIKYFGQTNLDEISHTIEKLRKLSEKVEFKNQHQIELRIKLVRKVDKAITLIKEKEILIKQKETKVQRF